VNALTALAIVIHLTNVPDAPASVVRDAQQQVTDLFRDAGIEVRWEIESQSLRGHAEAVRLTLLPFETGALQRGRGAVLGAAIPSADGIGTAWVFYQRVAREADRHGVAIAPILASAIAHEIGHLLQRRRGHAERGLMRACWNRADYLRASAGRLRFSAADAADFGALVASPLGRSAAPTFVCAQRAAQAAESAESHLIKAR
jgi:hypothetical protein